MYCVVRSFFVLSFRRLGGGAPLGSTKMDSPASDDFRGDALPDAGGESGLSGVKGRWGGKLGDRESSDSGDDGGP